MDPRVGPAGAADNGSHHASPTTQLGHRRGEMAIQISLVTLPLALALLAAAVGAAFDDGDST
jgi:hypothetical protein